MIHSIYTYIYRHTHTQKLQTIMILFFENDMKIKASWLNWVMLYDLMWH